VALTATDPYGKSAKIQFDIAVANTNDDPAGVVSIGGTTTQGETLAASCALNDEDGLGPISYQWQSSVDGVTWSDISGALADILVLTTAQVGRQLRVVASYVDGRGTSESVFSQASSKVAGRGLNLTGTNGNDRLTGAATDDTLSGGLGTDWLSGGAGDDSLCFSADGLWTSGFVCRNDGSPGHAGSGKTVSIAGYSRSFDGMDGGTGTDQLLGTAGNDVFVLDDTYSSRPNGVAPRFAFIERFEAGDGNDVVDLTSCRWAYGDVTVAGGNGDDVIWTSGGNDCLSGEAGNDTLDGGWGRDLMAGGHGNDAYVIDSLGDTAFEAAGEGDDTVQSYVSYALGSHFENLSLEGIASVDGTGNELNNLLTGNASSNTLRGVAGNDTLDGKGAKDILIGGDGGDTYLFGRSYSRDVIRENDAASGATDTVRFLKGIDAKEIWLRHVGNDLEASIIGTTDKLVLENWYLGSRYQVEQFKTSDGKLLLDSQVENLVQAMAAFAPPAAGQTTLPATYQEYLAPLIAANWR
jgi:Ca2+-binding RTX toxin-like protein